MYFPAPGAWHFPQHLPTTKHGVWSQSDLHFDICQWLHISWLLHQPFQVQSVFMIHLTQNWRHVASTIAMCGRIWFTLVFSSFSWQSTI